MIKNIQTQLIKPFIEKMEKEWQALYQEVRQSKVPEAIELRPLVESHISKLRQLRMSDESHPNSKSALPTGLPDFVRQSKMDLRSAERRWKKHLVSTARVKTRLKNYSVKAAQLPPSKKS